MIDYQREVLRGETVVLAPEKAASLEQCLFQADATPFAGSGRRINRFMVGADPEFMFLDGTRIHHATDLGLRPGLAFGADQNDRLVELRPGPSRSALEVVASTLAELRWLYRAVPLCRNLTWYAGAFSNNDGMGGHVHFGRKRLGREAEVAGLDGLARTLRRAGVFCNTEWDARCAGDQFHQRYGQYGDIRVQKHGYEYRTLPTWLDSPQLAFLVLTLAKLVVVDPEITGAWNERSPRTAWQMLTGLTNYYRGRDDDAWMLASLMNRPEMFAFQGGDFKARWGLAGSPAGMEGLIYPSCIPAHREDTDDLLLHFTQGKPLPMREAQASFRTTLPGGYQWVPNLVSFRRRPGVGELVHDLVTSEKHTVRWHFDEVPDFVVRVPNTFQGGELLRSALSAIHPCNYNRNADNNFHIYIGRDMRREPVLSALREVLTGGLLPIWKVNAVEENSFADWKKKWIAVKPKAELPEGKALGHVPRSPAAQAEQNQREAFYIYARALQAQNHSGSANFNGPAPRWSTPSDVAI